MIGLLNVNKPKGISSNAVLTKIKKQFNISKMGHLGTLDPMAEGVLPVTIGKATRLFDYFLKKDKTYLATFTFGVETDTLDCEGKVVKESKVLPTKKAIETIIADFVGDINQLPPKFSAKKINGKKAYELARENKEFTLKPKLVTVYKFNLLEQINESTFTFFIHCSSGTYIRSLARDLAYKLNTVGFMSALTRQSSGLFELKNSVSLETLLKGDIKNYLVPVEEVLKGLERVDLEDKYYDFLKTGKKIKFENKNEEFLLYCKNEFFGIGCVKQGYLKIKTYLKVD